MKKSIKIITSNKIVWGQEPDCFGPHYRYRQDLIISKILSHYKTGKILDAGCGSGWLSVRLAKLGFKVWGIDTAGGSIKYCVKNAKESGLSSKLKFKIGDIRKTGFDDNYFDVIICSEVIEHIENDKKTIASLAKILKKNGLCIVTVPAHVNLWGIEDEVGGHYRRYTLKTLSVLFKKWHVITNDYFGYPIGSFYYHYIYRPIMVAKLGRMGEGKGYTNNYFNLLMTVVKKLASNQMLLGIMSFPFIIDNLFIGNKKGHALILVAKKPDDR